MKKILVVDDDQNMNEFTSRLLRNKHQCEVVSVYNAIDAFYYLENFNFDLTILDISMPIIDGMEVLTLIRENENLKKMPVVMMTANRDKDTITEVIKLGVLDYIAKPLTVEGTNKKLADILTKISIANQSANKIGRVLSDKDILIAENDATLKKNFNESSSSDFNCTFVTSGIDVLKQYIKIKPKKVYLGKEILGLNRAFIIKALRKIDNNGGLKIIVNGNQDDFSPEIREDVNEFVFDNFEKIKSIIF